MKIELNCPLSTYLHTHRLLHLSAFTTEAYLSSIWLLLQRFITGQHARLRDCKILGPKWDNYITPLPLKLGVIIKRRQKDSRSKGSGRRQRNRVFWTWDGVTHMDTQGLWLHTQDLDRSSHPKSQHGWKRGLSPTLSLRDCWHLMAAEEQESIFFRDVDWRLPMFQRQPHPHTHASCTGLSTFKTIQKKKEIVVRGLGEELKIK